MGPTYATGDPMALNYSGDGLVVEDRADDHLGDRVPIPDPRMVISNPGNPRRMARMNGYRGFGQTELPAVYEPEMYTMQASSPGILDSIGNALGSIIQTIGLQAPGMITGQPTSGYYPTTQPSAFGGIPPILLIGGGVLLFWYLSKK
jgi:hypothetical protein